MSGHQPKTGQPCGCKRGVQRDNCPSCEGTGQRIDFAAIRGKRPRTSEFFDQVEAAGIPFDNHESDLYVKNTPEARALIEAAGFNATGFRHAVTGEAWLEVAFAYAPWWRARAR